jgi:hypothetical protein
VAARKRKQESLYGDALRDKAAAPRFSLASIAGRHQVCARELQRRWRRYQAAVRDGHPSPLTCAASDRRGGHNRAFAAQHESLLKDLVLNAPTTMTQNEIQSTALQLHHDVNVASSRSLRTTRSVVSFKASPRFITQFKRRQRLSSHRSSLKFRSASAPDPVEQEHNILQYVNDVRTAIDTYGARNVLNMDETPVPKCEHPITGVVATGSGHAAQCRTDAGNRLNVTHFPAISAAGNHLQLCAIIKGKTERTLKKIRTDASAVTSRVRLYYSPSGWTNSAILVRWLADVVQPYLAGRAGALVMDDYHAHWTEDVRAAAAAIRLKLIKVPPGLTCEYQPLDVQFNGPMVKERQRIWLRHRLACPDAKDSEQKAVERAQMAYEGISRSSTVDAWRKAFLVN